MRFALLALVAACAPTELPALAIAGLSSYDGSPADLPLTVCDKPPIPTAIQLAPFRVRIPSLVPAVRDVGGDAALVYPDVFVGPYAAAVRVAPDGLVVNLPLNVADGLYPVRVIDPDGPSAELADAVRVEACP